MTFWKYKMLLITVCSSADVHQCGSTGGAESCRLTLHGKVEFRVQRSSPISMIDCALRAEQAQTIDALHWLALTRAPPSQHTALSRGAAMLDEIVTSVKVGVKFFFVLFLASVCLSVCSITQVTDGFLLEFIGKVVNRPRHKPLHFGNDSGSPTRSMTVLKEILFFLFFCFLLRVCHHGQANIIWMLNWHRNNVFRWNCTIGKN